MEKRGLSTKDRIILGIAFAIALCSGIFMLVSFVYLDLKSLTAWSYNLWDLLFQGRLGDFYSYCIENARGAAHEKCAGSWLDLTILMVWNFPAWLFNVVFGNGPLLSLGYFIWTKLFYIICVCVTSWIIYSLLRIHIDHESALLAAILIAFSPETMLSTLYAGQDEVVYIMFFWLMVYFWHKGKTLLAILVSIVMVAICPMMLAPLLAVKLMTEKNVIKDILHLIITMVPSLIFGVIYGNDAVFNDSKNPLSEYLFEIFGDATKTGVGDVSIAFILFLVLFFISFYCVKIDSLTAEKNKLILPLAILSIMMFELANTMEFYRIPIYVSFFIVFMFLCDGNKDIIMTVFILFCFVRIPFMLAKSSGMNYNTQFLGNYESLNNLLGAFHRTLVYDKSLWQMLVYRYEELEKFRILFNSVGLWGFFSIIYLGMTKRRFNSPIKVDSRIMLLLYLLIMPLVNILFLRYMTYSI